MALTDAERAHRYRDRRRRKKRVVEIIIDDADLSDLFDLYPLWRGNLSDPKVAEMLGALLFAGAVLRHTLWGRSVQSSDLEDL